MSTNGSIANSLNMKMYILLKMIYLKGILRLKLPTLGIMFLPCFALARSIPRAPKTGKNNYKSRKVQSQNYFDINHLKQTIHLHVKGIWKSTLPAIFIQVLLFSCHLAALCDTCTLKSGYFQNLNKNCWKGRFPNSFNMQMYFLL